MKYVIALLIVLSTAIAFAGEVVTTPQYLVVASPTTNKAEKMKIEINWGNPNFAKLSWRVLSQDESQVVAEHSFIVFDRSDDPETDVELCTAEGVPFSCCTGEGTGDCDESTTDFTDFVQGFATTLNTRAEALMWSDAQDRYPTQATP